MVGSRKQTAFRSHRGSAPFGLVRNKGRWKGGVVGENNGDSRGGIKERQGFEESVWSFSQLKELSIALKLDRMERVEEAQGRIIMSGLSIESVVPMWRNSER